MRACRSVAHRLPKPCTAVEGRTIAAMRSFRVAAIALNDTSLRFVELPRCRCVAGITDLFSFIKGVERCGGRYDESDALA